MSGYGVSSSGYASNKVTATARPKRRKKEMKLTFKQRIRNWLNRDDDESIPEAVLETASLQSEGMRFQLYKAAGGYVIETTQYDNRTDRRHNKMYVVTEDKDLGAELGKIITMEALRA